MSENTSATRAPASLHISSIVIRLDGASNKKVDFAELKLDSQRQEIHRVSDQDKDLSAKFDPAIAVTTERVSLSVHCQHHTMGVVPRKTTVKFSLDRKDIMSTPVDPDGQREYRTTKGKMTVIVLILSTMTVCTRQLQPTSSDILQICPKFRLLVTGKTGVGKSSLIQQAFKITEVHVSEHRRGKADIDKEFIAPENERFVLHDSQGFETGDSGSFAIAKDFIDRRRQMPELKDKIHAVWLCLPIPRADGRLLEGGVEEFLISRKKILGNIPIIVVFTKLDLVVNELEIDAMVSGTYDEAVIEALKNDTLDKLCVQPLKEVAGSDIPHATVSTEAKYESTVRQLIDITTTNVEKFVASEAALAMMIAQRVDIDLKIKASIAIGKKRYWRGLASGMNFTGFTLWDCLSVIHQDIIAVWNFNDPHRYLLDDKFKELILKDLDNDNFPNPAGALRFGLSVVAAITTILAPIAAPFLPIVVPVVAGVVLVKWAYDVYQRTNIVLRRIMTYIVDLTCIMQILFLLAPTGSISRRSVIKFAMNAYEKAGKGDVHSVIRSHVHVTRSGGDDALEEILRLIEDHSIKAGEVQDLRTNIGPPIDFQVDEEW